MKISTNRYQGRQAWVLDNDTIALTLMVGGGHIAALELKDKPGINPLWDPPWKSLEPWDYVPAKHAGAYQLKLLASILGHNICLGWFGDPSASEAAAGLEVHGEAPVAKWRLVGKPVTEAGVALTCKCDLPVSQMQLTRTISSAKSSRVIHVKEVVTSTSRRDLPFTLCEHATVGPPFLEKGVTVFDMPATQAHTFPGPFSPRMRLRPDTAFVWPVGPAARGRKIDLRQIAKADSASSDFTTQLINPERDSAWVSAVNPKLGLLLAYVWKREDLPWVGNWEENYGRTGAPWKGQTLTRGLEFSNTPFPVGLRTAVDRGRFQGQPTYRWLPALGRVEVEFDILLAAIPETTTGVAEIRQSRRAYTVDLMGAPEMRVQ